METESEAAIPRLDDPASDALLDQLAHEAARLACGALGGHDIRQVWSEPHCVRFRLQDGRTGSVEVLINWDVVNEGATTESDRMAARLVLPHPSVGGSLAP